MERIGQDGYIVYLDTGGTFSDAVVVDAAGNFVSGKAPTTPEELSECFFACISDAAEKSGMSLWDLFGRTQLVGFGTTAGTNALITRVGGPRLGLITTKGFEDTTIIMRMEGKWAGLPRQESIHIAGCDKPEPLIPRDLILGVTERVDSRGAIVFPMREDEAREAVRSLLEQGVRGIAVAFLWSFLNDSHERRMLEIIREMAPDLPVSLSSQVAPVMREDPRFNSTIVNLFIGAPVRKLLGKIGNRLREYGFGRDLLVMQSSGGLSRAQVVEPIQTLHSGPVGGLIGVDFLKRVYAERVALGTDMGGTSFDISLSGETGPEFEKTPVVCRFHLANPMLGVEAIGAGGGTIARIDPETGRLHLGPQSAGAVPGPTCYDRGGTEPTVTDADVVLGRIPTDFFLDGKMKLNREKALAVIEEKIARPLGLDPVRAALGIVKGIDGIMRSAIIGFLNQRGQDPRRAVLISFGGAGPTHCAGYTAEVGFKRILIPPYAATFSAFGAATADVRHRYETGTLLVMPALPYDVTTQRFHVDSLEAVPTEVVERFNRGFQLLEERAYAEMGAEGFPPDRVDLSHGVEMRYGGQLRDIPCRCRVRRMQAPSDLQQLLEAFEAEYIRLFTQGTQYPRGGVEIITLVVEAAAPPGIKPALLRRSLECADSTHAVKGRRPVFFDEAWLDTPIYDIRRLRSGNRVPGPAVIEGNDTTVVVPPRVGIEVDTFGMLELWPTAS